MAQIEIGPLTDRLSDAEIAELAKQMEHLGAPQLPRGDSSEVATVSDDLDEDALAEFYDRLDGHDAAAEIYLPIEFDGLVEVAGLRVGSASALIDVLDELKDELSLGDDEDEDLEEEDEDEDEDDRRLLGADLRQVWKSLYDGAHTAIDKKLPLHVKT